MPIGPAIGALPLKMIVYKFAGIVLSILFKPEFGMLIFPPFRQIEKIRPQPIAFIVSPLADIEVAFAIPVRTRPARRPRSQLPT